MKRLLLALLFLGSSSVFAALTAEVNPQRVQLGESFRLTLISDDASLRGLPDLTPLEKDFSIQATEQSSSYTSVNGQAHSTRQWGVVLIAKTAGTLPIPSLHVGKEQSVATQIVVAAATDTKSQSDKTAASNDGILFTVEVSNEAPYLNEQVIYTVKLLNRIQLLSAEYQPPQVENALLVPLAQGNHSQITLNGFNYKVDEQQYAVFPQQSGEITINPPMLNAMVFDFQPKRVLLAGKAKKLTVKPIPQGIAPKDWLPSKQVTLIEGYEQSAPTIKQGDTITRTIQLDAMGVPAELLPTLNFDRNEQFSLYPEKQETQNAFKQRELVGKAKVKVTYLLNKSGEITIPEFKLPWFNTVTGQAEMATLPAHKLTVMSSDGTAPQVKSTPQASTIAPQTSPVVPRLVRGIQENNNQTITFWLAIGFATAWIVTLILWWYKPRLLKPRHGRRSIAIKRLRIACAENNPTEARTALLNWAALRWPNTVILNLNDITHLVTDAELKKQLNLLSLALYSQNGKTTWLGDALWHCVVAYKSKKLKLKKKKRKTDSLPPINPI